MKAKKGCLIPVLLVFAILIALIVIIMKLGINDVETSENTIDEEQVIFDTMKYSRITKDELISELGKPNSKEKWTNKTSRGNFNLMILSYDIDTNHLEFIIADDSVVRLSIYSNAYWNNKGNRFKFNGTKENICKLFNISLGENATIKTDNNITYMISPVNDKIAMFDVQDMKTNDFGFVKITYNLNYFDE